MTSSSSSRDWPCRGLQITEASPATCRKKDKDYEHNEPEKLIDPIVGQKRSACSPTRLPANSVIRAIRPVLHPGTFRPTFVSCQKPGPKIFCFFRQRNPKPCPLIARSDVGDPRLPTLAKDLDIRTDVPRYHVFCDGKFVEEVTDITRYWQDDLVTFALGCSFSFEEALQDAGIPLPFLEKDSVAGVYVSSLPTELAGPYKAPLVVTMRAFKPADAIRAIQITSRFPNVHGAPVHIGNPAQIGVDLSNRYQNVGDGTVGDGQIPGVSGLRSHSLSRRRSAKPPLCITHAPSSMLVTDLSNASLAML